MKKRVLILLAVICAICVVLSGCSKGVRNASDKAALPSDTDDIGVEPENGSGNVAAVVERKIIYTADLTLYAYDVEALKEAIEGSLEEGEWFDQKRVNNADSAYYVVRIKSERLEAYLDEIGALADQKNLSLDAQDISLAYQSIEDRIDALNEEKALLIAYVGDDPALGLQVATRVSQINSEIRALNNALDRYDSLEELSVVNISVSKLYTPEEAKYNEEAKNTFNGAWKAFVRMFEIIGLIIIAVFPFALVIAPVTVGSIFLVKFLKKRKQKEHPEKEDNDKKSE